MKVYPVGTVDYELDRYGNRIRKYVVVKLEKVHGKMHPVWEEADFKPKKLTSK